MKVVRLLAGPTMGFDDYLAHFVASAKGRATEYQLPIKSILGYILSAPGFIVSVGILAKMIL
jgi:hypothetical protein